MKNSYALKLTSVAPRIFTLPCTVLCLVLANCAAPPTPASQPASALRVSTVEFHIVADSITANADDLKTIESRLDPGGPGPMPQPGDAIRWVEVEHPEDFDRPGSTPQTRQWNGIHFMPVLVTPDASMDPSSTPQWNITNVHPSADQNGGKAISFSFDPHGAMIFSDLTTRWYKFVSEKNDPNARPRLAFIVGDKIISAPHLMSAITGGSCEITGGGIKGFSDEELKRLIEALDARSAPAH